MMRAKEFNNYRATRARTGHVVLRDGRSVSIGARVRVTRPGFEDKIFMYAGRDSRSGRLKLFEDGGGFAQMLVEAREVTAD
jgi:hypothetical protein